MDKNEILEIIKKIKRKAVITEIITILAVIFCIIFLTNGFAKYLLPNFMVIAAGLIVLYRQYNVDYLLYDECNPRLYYAVSTGLKITPAPIMQALVAEFIGDYASAIKIFKSILESSRKKTIKNTCLIAISRNAFFINDFELCKKCIDDFYKLEPSKKIYAFDIKRTEFYLAYMNGEYVKSKLILDELRNSEKQGNSLKCILMYYDALVSYALNDLELAKAEFTKIAEKYPNMYLANASKQHLQSIDSGAEIVITPVASCDIPASAIPQKADKEQLRKALFAIIILVGMFASSFYQLSNLGKEDTPIDAIEDANSIIQTIEINNDCSVRIFLTSDDLLGVSYMKYDGKRYVSAIENVDDYLAISVSPDDNYAKMHASGYSQEIRYKWVSDKANAQEDDEIIELQYKGEPIYFCYKLMPEKMYFVNSYSIVSEQ